MNFKDLFFSKKKNESLSQLVNLITLAKIDGYFSQSELDFITAIAIKKGISPKDFTKAIVTPEKIKYGFPKDEETKIGNMAELILLMLNDDKMDEKEMELCYKYGQALGYSKNWIDGFVKKIVIEREINKHPEFKMLFRGSLKK